MSGFIASKADALAYFLCDEAPPRGTTAKLIRRLLFEATGFTVYSEFLQYKNTECHVQTSIRLHCLSNLQVNHFTVCGSDLRAANFSWHLGSTVIPETCNQNFITQF